MVATSCFRSLEPCGRQMVNVSVAGMVMPQSSPGMLQGALVEGACLESSVNDGAMRQLTLAPYVQSAVRGTRWRTVLARHD